ncbi:MAG: hypothetical protein IPJ79_13900 [Bacteroidetes bacterium]|nr:hypothetical protein [Bacteroidota bacterium]
MNFFKTIIYAALICQLPIANSLFAQVVPPPASSDETIEDKIENIASDADESVDLTQLTEQFEYLKENPVNLNTSTREELESTGLFTPQQVNAIIRHRDSTGYLMDVRELQVLNGFDIPFIVSVLPYITVYDLQKEIKSSIRNIAKYGRSRFIIRTTQVPQNSEGYKRNEEDATEGYLGSPLKLYAQYRYSFRRNFSFNITGEKDAGEQFFDSTQKKGFDFYSAHLAIRDIGMVKTFVLGDYALQYGQGLTMWRGLYYGKSSDANNIKRNAEGIRPYSSVNEQLFARGVAVALGKRNWSADVFFSRKEFDANAVLISTPQSEEEIITAFVDDGYHRTSLELFKKNKIGEDLVGGNFSWRLPNFKIGATIVNASYTIPYIKTAQPYNAFDFTGDHLLKAGIDYSYLYRNLNFFGEVCYADNGTVAMVNGLISSLGNNISMSVLNRRYPRSFNSLYSVAFGEATRNQNENGTYVGLVTKPFKHITLSAYYDMFTFPCLTFLADAPSKGFEYLWQVTYTPSRNVELYVRGRQKTKEENARTETFLTDYLVDNTRWNYRFNISYKISKAFTLKSRIETAKVYKQGEEKELGFLFYQDIIFKPLSFPISFAARYCIFDTDSYNSRIYTYENDVVGSYSIPAFADRGTRYYLMARYTIKKGVDVWLRYAQTSYSNVSRVGSGLDEIAGNTKSEIKVQLRLQF